VYWPVQGGYWRVQGLYWRVQDVYWRVQGVYWCVQDVYWRVKNSIRMCEDVITCDWRSVVRGDFMNVAY
jgi:hypothetical protein